MKISVCLATYNGEKYIYKQIESIISQLGKNDEIIISDDSSNDKTIEIIKTFKDERIRIFCDNTFFSPIYNIENAIKNASGEIIVLSDQDDIWLDNKIQIINDRFRKNQTRPLTLVLDGIIIDEDGKVLAPSIFEWLRSGKGLIKNIVKNTYMGCCMAFSRDLLKKILPFPRGIPMHDVWIGLVSELYGRVEFVAEKTLLYRKHGMNKSFQKVSLCQKIKWRWVLIWNLLIKAKKTPFP